MHEVIEASHGSSGNRSGNRSNRGAGDAEDGEHALVATLVQVVNTASQPVPTMATDALNSFVATNSCSFALDGVFGLTDTCAIQPLSASSEGCSVDVSGHLVSVP